MVNSTGSSSDGNAYDTSSRNSSADSVNLSLERQIAACRLEIKKVKGQIALNKQRNLRGGGGATKKVDENVEEFTL